jgi:ubiquinone/menaquinone biosynthesis C-methylase UbiE
MPADHYQRIYREEAEAYDRMVEAEDCDGRLLPALEAACPLAGIDVAEVGVGTGRVTRLLARAGVRRITGFDSAPAMLEVARRRLEAMSPAGLQWQLEVADAAALPLPDDAVDLALAGWVFGHFRSWHPTDWPDRVDAAVAELRRVTRPGGHVVIIETLGTGASQPAPPTEGLASYYEHLERRHGFTRTAVPTDYAFPSPEAAAAACGFFFGPEFARRIVDERWARVPEWTGLWATRVER